LRRLTLPEGSPAPGVAIIVATLNEVGTIRRLLSTIASQTLTPSELIIGDGGSTDGTIAAVLDLAKTLPYPVRIVSQRGNISIGRNAAIAASSAGIIAVTDADCVPEKDWLSLLTRPIREGIAAAVAGSYRPLASGALQQAISVFSSVDPKNPSMFRPSHRSVAFLREVWRLVGGYDERIEHGEDTVFDIAVERSFPFTLEPRAQVAWPVRTTFSAALQQQFNYGAGDGSARIQPAYHISIALFVLFEIAILVGTGAQRLLGALAVAVASCFFLMRLFGRFRNQVHLLALAYTLLLLSILPPVRLAGFALGLYKSIRNALR
jgi:glycosyltransferase involved in cell wall biosynthesis